MFGRIAGVYDLLNHVLSLGIDRHWRRELAALAQCGDRGMVADLAAGTLDVSLALLRAHPDIVVPAVDFCPGMLRRGLRKLDSPFLRQRILPCGGDAMHLPLRDNCADSLTMAFGIRNIPDRMGAFAEMLRILAPGGRACILEFGSGQERIWCGIYNLYLNHLLPAIGRLIARDKAAYAYLARTIREFPKASALAAEMEAAGFADVSYRRLTSGIVCIHWGQKPR